MACELRGAMLYCVVVPTRLGAEYGAIVLHAIRIMRTNATKRKNRYVTCLDIHPPNLRVVLSIPLQQCIGWAVLQWRRCWVSNSMVLAVGAVLSVICHGMVLASGCGREW